MHREVILTGVTPPAYCDAEWIYTEPRPVPPCIPRYSPVTGILARPLSEPQQWDPDRCLANSLLTNDYAKSA